MQKGLFDESAVYTCQACLDRSKKNTGREDPENPLWKRFDAIPPKFLKPSQQATGIIRPSTLKAAQMMIDKANEIFKEEKAKSKK